MRTSRFTYSGVLISSLLFSGTLLHLNARQPVRNPAPVKRDREGAFRNNGTVALPAPAASGIHEVISSKYAKRYQEWKDEFLSTDIGRAQWEMYQHNPKFLLTITTATENGNGAGTGNFKWDESGNLIAATIALGKRIDEGYPSPVYYPVMNAIAPYESANLISGNVLAAAKIAHEFGHVIRMAATKEELFHLQVKLVPIYNKIFLSNGYNVDDPRLVEMAQQMGGNPVEIWEDREYWGEANAMLYLRDRFANDPLHCRLFGKIKRAVDLYAKRYEDRFSEIARSQGVVYTCGWK